MDRRRRRRRGLDRLLPSDHQPFAVPSAPVLQRLGRGSLQRVFADHQQLGLGMRPDQSIKALQQVRERRELELDARHRKATDLGLIATARPQCRSQEHGAGDRQTGSRSTAVVGFNGLQQCHPLGSDPGQAESEPVDSQALQDLRCQPDRPAPSGREPGEAQPPHLAAQVFDAAPKHRHQERCPASAPPDLDAVRHQEEARVEQRQNAPQGDGGRMEEVPQEDHLRDVHPEADRHARVECLARRGQASEFEQAAQVADDQPSPGREQEGRVKQPDRTQGQESRGKGLQG